MSAGEIFLTDCLKECSWSLLHRQSEPTATRENSGQVVEWGRPYWQIACRYDNLSESAFRALTAWLARRQGGRVIFTAYRPDRPAPLLHPSMSNSGIDVADVDIDASTIDMTGLGANVLSPGDMVSYLAVSGRFWVGEVTVTATPTAGAATVSVWPPPLEPHASLLTPRVNQAIGHFQIIGQPSISEPSSRIRNVEFNARQVTFF
jgi:hypothetical protein